MIKRIPNILSSYRIAAAPVIAWALWSDARALFASLIIANLITDILDGLLARLLHAESDLGAKLDSYADITTYVLAVCGLFRFEMPVVRENAIAMVALLGMYLVPQLISLARFRRPLSLHLYSSKASGYALGSFFVVLFAHGFSPGLFYLAATVAILNGLEEIAVLLVLREPRSNARGLLWVLK